MTRSRLLALAALATITVSARAEPVLRRVVLSSGGVGQFEFAGEVEGAASLTLDVPLDQVDDVLKSLVVDDPAGPFLGVRLPGQQPLSESFRVLPFKPDAFASPDALLAALVGEGVRVPSTGARGTILSVSDFDEPGPPGTPGVTRHRLAIATDTGLAMVVLEDAPEIEFTSATLRGQVATALAAIAAQRVQDRRALSLGLRDGPRRSVRFGYVVPVPVWKTSYRLTLPPGDAGTAHLQAFAVVENLSGRDWHDVSVTLTSGRPVLFHTPLYQSLFATRPEAPVDVPGAVVPSLDAFQAAALAAPAEGPVVRSPAAPGPGESNPLLPTAKGPREPLARAARPVQPPSAIAQSVASVEFRLSSPVTAGSGQSLLLPILDRAIPAHRIAYFQPGSDQVHPLVALHLVNDGPGALPPGVVSLFDRGADGADSYVGDARLPAILPGEDRLASFSVDLGVTVEDRTEDDTRYAGATIANGVLTLDTRDRHSDTYRIATPKAAGRTLVIDQPKREGRDLIEPSGKGVTETPDAWRITADIPAGTTQSIRITTERTVSQGLVLLDLDDETVAGVSADGHLPSPLRQAVEHAAALKAEAARIGTDMASLRSRIADIVADQGRVRSNLAAVPAGSALQREYLATLQTQEGELSAVRGQVEAARNRQQAAARALRDYVMSLKL